MSGPEAPQVCLAEDERQELLALTRAHRTPQHLSFRKPHRSRYWLNRAPAEAADEKMADGTALYLQAPTLHAAGERVMSTDAMTGIQALERKPPTIPMGPGRVERRECAYMRHGTLTLSANFDVAQGQVVTLPTKLLTCR